MSETEANWDYSRLDLRLGNRWQRLELRRNSALDARGLQSAVHKFSNSYDSFIIPLLDVTRTFLVSILTTPMKHRAVLITGGRNTVDVL